MYNQFMHKSRLCYLVIDVNNHERAISFWGDALGATTNFDESWEDSVYRRLKIPNQDIQILLQLVPEEKLSKSRLHIDIESDDIDAELQRLLAIGATNIETKDELGFRWHVMNDPFGNEFCILNTEFPEAIEQKGIVWK